MDYLLAENRMQNNYQSHEGLVLQLQEGEEGSCWNRTDAASSLGRSWLIRNMKPFTALQAWPSSSTVSNNRSYRKEIKTHKLSHSSDRSALILNICVFKCKHQNENVPGFSCKPRSRATHVPPERSLIRPSGPLCS